MTMNYLTDAWQHSVLYADVMRERGNQYKAHLAEKTPNVLDFPAELVMSGRDLPRPVNYALARILPPEEMPADRTKRPFVVVDPRAGHGPGIGGFKPDSEIGAAVHAGHPCYFVGFLPDPFSGQTVEDVMRAEAAFLEKVIELHPDSQGKPAVIGNCQAGWQVLMTAAMRPELFGPIIVAGAPLSYWAGWHGKNPMRYAGGLMGGSWLTAMTSDLGAGRFDGAWLVANFENLNPANTLWKKQYDLYSKVDTEAPRHLGFEKYWGGHVFLNDVEMQYIVDNLFIGNRLAAAELVTSDGIRLDLRNIRSPIVVFCSYGDNITPPPQALGWITDLYRDEVDVLSHDQTIVYATHDSIGHLGIFVSGSVGRKEHQKFAANIDLIDLLPSGIFEAVIKPKSGQTLNPELVDGNYLLAIKPRTLENIREIVQSDPESDRRFDAVARLSGINLGLYRTFAQPWVRAIVTPESARWLHKLHPIRIAYEWWSDDNPLAAPIADLAQKVRDDRKPVTADNPLLRAQETVSDAIEAALNQWRDLRDNAYERTFELLYGSPWIQALVGQKGADQEPPRSHPSVSPEHRQFIASKIAQLRSAMTEGGLTAAAIRAIFFVQRHRPEIDERRFNLALRLHREAPSEGHNEMPTDIDTFRGIVRQQTNLLRLDLDGAILALPQVLARSAPDEIRRLADVLAKLFAAGEPLDGIEQQDLDRIFGVLESAAQQARSSNLLSSESDIGEKGQAAAR
uniref:3-hydroxyalkanoate synthetase n=1 Tax=Burkholderia cenocepacia TaxID=95486 RepID=A0A071MGL7_9BURK